MAAVKLAKENKMFGGWVKKFTHESAATKTTMTFSVYFPESYKGDSKIPVLYYLSGLTCTDDNFITKGFGEFAANEYNIALVAPDTSPRGLKLPGEHDSYDFGSGAGFYVDATVEPYSEHYNMYTYVTKELEEVLSHGDNEKYFSGLNLGCKSIMGHSMGGHGALTCALKNPGVYKSVSAFAPICNPMNCPWGQKAFRGYFGEEMTKWEAHDASVLAKKYENDDKLNILVDQGVADEFYEKKQLLPEALKESCSQNEKNLSLDLRFQEGYDHSYFTIASFMSDHIAFHAKFLSSV